MIWQKQLSTYIIESHKGDTLLSVFLDAGDIAIFASNQEHFHLMLDTIQAWLNKIDGKIWIVRIRLSISYQRECSKLTKPSTVDLHLLYFAFIFPEHNGVIVVKLG